MARPKKNPSEIQGKIVKVYLTEEQINMLENICLVTNVSKSHAMARALDLMVLFLTSENGDTV